MQRQFSPARKPDQGSFGAQLRALRRAAGLTQEELAERAHLTTHAISALERGARTRPYPHTIRSLADALDATESDRASLIAAVPSRSPDTAAHETADDTAPRRGLPSPTTPLVARDTEIAQVAALLRDPTKRLVTLTGPGGVGKTRLEIAVASAVAATFPDGVVYVELAPLLDAAMLAPAVADLVGGRRLDTADAESAVIDSVGDGRLLLVLDNFEHLRAAAPQVARLLEGCPGLTVLVSSRAPLRVRGETEFAVQPLALPPDSRPSPDDIAASPAGALFLQRAHAVSPDLELTSADALAVSGICHRLAGIPLALELAAARVRFLDPPSLLTRLDDAIASDGARDLPARQRTMRAALDWSYGLLDHPEQALLRLLSCFSGGCTLEDAEAVAELAGTVRRSDVLRLMESLAEQSLVVARLNQTGPARYHLLEPIAQYAQAMLAGAGETAVVGSAHTRHFLDLAERAAPEYQRGQQVQWLARVDAEHANMTAAIERSLSDGSAESAGQIGWALWLYWWLRGHLLHGRRLMEAVLQQDLTTDVRTRTEIAAATMAFALDDLAGSRGWWQSALDRARVTGDPLAQANAMAGVGLTSLAANDLTEAEALFTASAPFAQAAGEDGEWVGALIQVWLGTVAMLTGDPGSALARMECGLASARGRGDRLTMYIAFYNLSQVAASRGDLATAREYLEDGMRLSMETGDHANLAYLLDALAVVEAGEGSHLRVPVLLGAAASIRDAIGTKAYGYYRPDEEQGRRAAVAARDYLGADRYDDALDVGRALDPAEVVAFGLTRDAHTP